MILNAQHLARIGLHQLLVVRGHDDQCALFLTDAMQQGCYLHASLSIKVARWFVCQYNLWMIQHGTRYHHALLLASLQLVG